MDKGIRPAARVKFVEFNELRRRNADPFVGPKANTLFRAAVIDYLIENFGITLASAATHYNEAFKHVKELNSELVDGLGRAEDKKGGRKPKAEVVATTATEQKTEAAAETGTATITDAAAMVGLEGLLKEEPELCSVVKSKDGSVVAEGITREQAEQLVAKAASQKKAKLEIR